MNDPNRKKIWGVIMGSPTPNHPYEGTKLVQVAKDHLGLWMVGIRSVRLRDDTKVPPLFFTRAEAEKFAAQCAAINLFWNYHPKKFNPRKQYDT